jgi:hypothetical protein
MKNKKDARKIESDCLDAGHSDEEKYCIGDLVIWPCVESSYSVRRSDLKGDFPRPTEPVNDMWTVLAASTGKSP